MDAAAPTLECVSLIGILLSSQAKKTQAVVKPPVDTDFETNSGKQLYLALPCSCT